jgi:hypothetical protein
MGQVVGSWWACAEGGAEPGTQARECAGMGGEGVEGPGVRDGSSCWSLMLGDVVSFEMRAVKIVGRGAGCDGGPALGDNALHEVRICRAATPPRARPRRRLAAGIDSAIAIAIAIATCCACARC